MPAKELDLQREFIIMTDGEDNCSSSSSRQQSTQKLMEPGIPHFHALFIGIDMGESVSKPIKFVIFLFFFSSQFIFVFFPNLIISSF